MFSETYQTAWHVHLPWVAHDDRTGAGSLGEHVTLPDGITRCPYHLRCLATDRCTRCLQADIVHRNQQTLLVNVV